MRILLLTDEYPPDHRGGDGVIVAGLARAYQERGHEVFVFAATVTPALSGDTMEQGIVVVRVYAPYPRRLRAWYSLYNPSALKRLKIALDSFKPEIVHAHGVNAYVSYYALILAYKKGARVYLTAHDAMLYHYGKAANESFMSAFALMRYAGLRYNPFRNIFIRQVLKSVEGITAVSESLARSLEANNIMVCAVIHNGIRLADVRLPPNQLMETFRIQYGLTGKRMILFAGRLGELKGGRATLEAFARVYKEMPDTVLLVAGRRDGYGQEMERLARELGIADSLVITGWLTGEELTAAYAVSTAVVLPSLYPEPFGMVALEAMAIGKAVVGTHLGGVPEIVVDGETGYIVDPRDAVRYASRLLTLLRDPALAAGMGAAGQERVRAQFSLAKQADRYLKLFNTPS